MLGHPEWRQAQPILKVIGRVKALEEIYWKEIHILLTNVLEEKFKVDAPLQVGSRQFWGH